MLAPPKQSTEADMRSALSTCQVVTVYAGAMRYVVSPLLVMQMPAWFDAVKATIATAVATATSWMDDLCIDVATLIPQSIINFAGCFDTVNDTMTNLETEIMMGSGTATAAQKQRAVDALKTLQSGIAKADGDMKAIDARLQSLGQKLQADHNALALASTTIAQNIPDGGTMSKTITMQLGDDFLDITPNGPCVVSINIKSDIDATIKSTAAAHGELLPYLIAQKVIDNGVADNAQATIAVSSLRAVWSMMSDLVDSAIGDITLAADKDVLPILQQAEFAAAQDVWARLSSIAKTLQ